MNEAKEMTIEERDNLLKSLEQDGVLFRKLKPGEETLPTDICLHPIPWKLRPIFPPKMEKTDEELAFEKWMEGRHYDFTSAREGWLAALEYGKCVRLAFALKYVDEHSRKK